MLKFKPLLKRTYKVLFYLSELQHKKNFEEFKLDTLTSDIQKKGDLRQNCSFRAKSTLIFYNMMMVTQTQQLSLRQNKPFQKMYLVKI